MASDRRAVAAGKGPAKLKKYLLPHERDLLEKGFLQNDTHANASSLWLKVVTSREGFQVGYRIAISTWLIGTLHCLLLSTYIFSLFSLLHYITDA